MTIAALNPWQVLDQLHSDNIRRRSSLQWQPLIDISESTSNYEITLELAGVSPDEVQLEQEEHVLKISGNKSRPESEDIQYRCRERTTGQFSRTFRLPEDADPSAIQAKFEQGLLQVRIPKKEQSKPRRIEIQRG